jgi:hypothetical protein
MIYGIEQTTDLRDRQTRIKKFTTKARALTWLSEGGKLAFPGDPKNAHHRLRELWEVKGSKPSWKKAYKDYITNCRHSTYRRYPEDFEAGAIRDHGIKIS